MANAAFGRPPGLPELPHIDLNLILGSLRLEFPHIPWPTLPGPIGGLIGFINWDLPGITLPNLLLDLQGWLPSLNWPNLTLALPEINLPDYTLPDFTLPDLCRLFLLRFPSLPWPDCSLPDFSGLFAPNITLSSPLKLDGFSADVAFSIAQRMPVVPRVGQSVALKFPYSVNPPVVHPVNLPHPIGPMLYAWLLPVASIELATAKAWPCHLVELFSILTSTLTSRSGSEAQARLESAVRNVLDAFAGLTLNINVLTVVSATSPEKLDPSKLLFDVEIFSVNDAMLCFLFNPLDSTLWDGLLLKPRDCWGHDFEDPRYDAAASLSARAVAIASAWRPLMAESVYQGAHFFFRWMNGRLHRSCMRGNCQSVLLDMALAPVDEEKLPPWAYGWATPALVPSDSGKRIRVQWDHRAGGFELYKSRSSQTPHIYSEVARGADTVGWTALNHSWERLPSALTDEKCRQLDFESSSTCRAWIQHRQGSSAAADGCRCIEGVLTNVPDERSSSLADRLTYGMSNLLLPNPWWQGRTIQSFAIQPDGQQAQQLALPRRVTLNQCANTRVADNAPPPLPPPSPPPPSPPPSSRRRKRRLIAAEAPGRRLSSLPPSSPSQPRDSTTQLLMGLQGCASAHLGSYPDVGLASRHYRLLPQLQFSSACFDARAYTWGAGIRMRAVMRLQAGDAFIAGNASANILMRIRPNDLAKPFERSASILLSINGAWPSPLGLGSDFSIRDARLLLSHTAIGPPGFMLAWGMLSWDLDVTFGAVTIRHNLLFEMAPHSSVQLNALGLPRLGCKLSIRAIALTNAMRLLTKLGKLASGALPLEASDLPLPRLLPAASTLLGFDFALDAELSTISDDTFSIGLFLSGNASAQSYGGFTVDFSFDLAFAPYVNADAEWNAFASNPLRAIEDAGLSLYAGVTLPFGLGTQYLRGVLSKDRFVMEMMTSISIAGFDLEARLSLLPTSISIEVSVSLFGLLGDVSVGLSGALSPTTLSLSLARCPSSPFSALDAPDLLASAPPLRRPHRPHR